MTARRFYLTGLEWREAGSSTYDKTSRSPGDSCLLAEVSIAKARFCVEAIRVTTDANGNQVPVDETLRGDYSYAQLLAACARLQTVDIQGHEGRYVLLVYPQED